MAKRRSTRKKGRRKRKKSGFFRKLLTVLLIAAVLVLSIDTGSFSLNDFLNESLFGWMQEDGEEAADPADSSDTDDSAASSEESLSLTVTQAGTGFDLSDADIPDYDGEAVVEIHDGETFFEEDEITTVFFIQITELDELGRAGSASMCADEAHMQTGERGDISEIHPSGWHGSGIYDRSHLLMWKLSGCDDERNFVTGTDTFNTSSMLTYESQVTEYLYENEDMHVMYRVTPLFEGENLLCTGVLIEALSAEDDGADLEFCVFCYNIESGYVIDYATGDYE